MSQGKYLRLVCHTKNKNQKYLFFKIRKDSSACSKNCLQEIFDLRNETRKFLSCNNLDEQV
jgi:hypothetical protein